MLRITVLAKPVPDPTSGAERLRVDGRLDRSAAPFTVNGNDEYALEAALRLVDALGGEITVVMMGPPGSDEAMRKALSLGAHRGIIITDDSLAGSDVLTTARVLAAALDNIEADLVLAGADSSDSGTGVVPAAVATILRLPYCSYAARIEADVVAHTLRVWRISPTGYDVLKAPMPALVVGTQALGEPRYPSLRGIMAARRKEVLVRSIADLGLDERAVAGGAGTTAVVQARSVEGRRARRIIRDSPQEAAREILAFLAERRIV